MIDDLEEALSQASLANLLGANLHFCGLPGKKVAEVNDGGDFGGRHGKLEKMFKVIRR